MELPGDEDDKVRRNLVSFSAALLLLAWLQVPLQKVLEKVGVVDPVQPWRAWSAAGAVLLYLWARFHHNGQGRDFLKKLKDKCDHQMYGYLHRQLGARPLPPKAADWITPRPSEVLQRGTQRMQEAGVPSVNTRAEVFFNGERWNTSGTYRLNIQWVEGPNNMVRFQHDEDVSYRVPWLTALRMRCKAVWFSWAFSAESLSWLAPVVLATAAASVIVLRLGAEALTLAGH